MTNGCTVKNIVDEAEAQEGSEKTHKCPMTTNVQNDKMRSLLKPTGGKRLTKRPRDARKNAAGRIQVAWRASRIRQLEASEAGGAKRTPNIKINDELLLDVSTYDKNTSSGEPIASPVPTLQASGHYRQWFFLYQCVPRSDHYSR